MNYCKTIFSGEKIENCDHDTVWGKEKQIPLNKLESSGWRKIKLTFFVYPTEFSPFNKLIVPFSLSYIFQHHFDTVCFTVPEVVNFYGLPPNSGWFWWANVPQVLQFLRFSFASDYINTWKFTICQFPHTKCLSHSIHELRGLYWIFGSYWSGSCNASDIFGIC